MQSIKTLPQWSLFLVIILLSILLLYLFSTLFSPVVAVGFVSIIAFVLAFFLHDGAWWKWIHLFFLPLVMLFLQFDIASYWYLLALVLSWLVFGRVMVSRVPLYLSNQQALIELEACIPEKALFIDIGAGTGRVLRYLALKRPDLCLFGVELAKAPWLWGRMRLPSSVRWMNADYQAINLADFDCIYAFLSPAVMEDLWQQARSQMKTGSLLISNTFVVPGVAPDQVIELNDWKNGKLLLWRM